jgi:hypothetical protein
VEREITVPPSDQKREAVQSEEILSAETRTRYDPSSSSGENQLSPTTKESGARPHGWIVRVFVGDVLVKVLASTSTLERIGSDAAQLASLQKQKPPLAPGQSAQSPTTQP